MPNPLANLVAASVADLAARVGGQPTTPGSWFDGFWDFFVENRDRLAREPAWEIQGATQLPWAIVMLASEAADRPLFESYLFVEAKDRRPGVTAPWPVSSVSLGDAAPPRLGERERFDRPHDAALADQLRRRSFVPLVGYWGVRCEAHVARDDPRGSDCVAEILSALPEALPLAMALAAGLPV